MESNGQSSHELAAGRSREEAYFFVLTERLEWIGAGNCSNREDGVN